MGHLEQIEELIQRKERVESMLNSKITMRDELNRAVHSLQRSASNLETEIDILRSEATDTSAADTFMDIFGFIRVSEQLGEYANEF